MVLRLLPLGLGEDGAPVWLVENDGAWGSLYTASGGVLAACTRHSKCQPELQRNET